MDRSCYRCGAQIEEGTTFCPSCSAPQIRVTVPSATDQPLTPPLPPGTPDSIQPPAIPVRFGPVERIQWRKFWRIALPLALINAASFVWGIAGVLVFTLGVVVAVSLYRRRHQGRLLASQGARLGAIAGLLTFAVIFILGISLVLHDPAEAHRQLLLAVQQKAASSPDPHMPQLIQFFATDQGFKAFLVFAALFTLAFCLVLGSAAGALTAVFSGNQRR
jgi:hypothetical protein